MFYYFDQNNSGGSFHSEMGYALIIEADSANEANDIAESKGVYFDGCANEQDCECCGDRWSRAWEDGGTELPERYGTVHDPDSQEFKTWGLPVYIHYKDGRVENFRCKQD
jgi:hypothetical protein